jgi:hypothetical protein
MKCALCEDCGWETILIGHGAVTTPATCGGAGAPCPRCNPTGDGEVPRPPKGFKTEFDKAGSQRGASVNPDAISAFGGTADVTGLDAG